MTRRSHRLLSLSLGFVAILGARLARAQPAPSDGDRAIELGREGKKLFGEEKWADALDKFQRADAIFHSPVFTLYEGRIAVRMGKLLQAKTAFQAVVDEPLDTAAEKSWALAHDDAKTELANVTASIPHVTIKLRNLASGPLPAVQLDHSLAPIDVPIEADPGDHTVSVALATGLIEKPVHLDAGASVEMPIDLPASAAPTEPIAPRPPETPKPLPAAPQAGSFVPGAIVLGVAGAAIIAGAITGGLAISEAGSIDPSCRKEPGCADPKLSDANAAKDRATTLGYASTGLFIAGGVAAIPGVVLLVVRPGRSSSSATAGAALVVAPNRVGVSGFF
jgi:hypothetical protein